LDESAVFLAVFLACLVEAVEALTIVLTAGNHPRVAALRNRVGRRFGDDPQLTVGVVAALVVTAAIAGNTTTPAWWIAAVAVLVFLPLSVRGAVRPQSATRMKREQT
jgi:hypothetical protein